MNKVITLILLLAVACSRQATKPTTQAVASSTPFVLASVNAKEPAVSGTVVYVDNFGAYGNGSLDDTAAMQLAINSLKSGGYVVFTPSKTYVKSDIVTVNANVKLWGYGATILSKIADPTDPRLAFKLVGSNSSIYGLRLTTDLRNRPQKPTSAGIWVTGDNNQIIDNYVEYTGTGVFIQSTHTLVARNDVSRTQADGISVSGGASLAIHDIIIAGNEVKENGDDMISVVNYGTGPPHINNVYVTSNNLHDNYWGNGIAVHGGARVTLYNNSINDIFFGSAIKIDSENSYSLGDVINTLVKDNNIANVHTGMPVYNPTNNKPIGPRSAIFIHASDGHIIDDVLFVNNSIINSATGGLSIDGAQACNIGYSGFNMTNVQGAQVTLAANVDPSCIDSPTVTGSDYLKLATGPAGPAIQP